MSTVSPEVIIRGVAGAYGTTPRALRGPDKSQVIARVRFVAAYLLRRLTPLSYPKIGAVLGGRHHTSVIHAIDRVNSDGELRRQAELLCGVAETWRRP